MAKPMLIKRLQKRVVRLRWSAMVSTMRRAGAGGRRYRDGRASGDVAVKPAAITLMRHSLMGVADALAISRATLRNMKPSTWRI